MILKRKLFGKSGLQDVADDVFFEELGSEGEAFKDKTKRIGGNIKRRVIHEYKTGSKLKKGTMIAIPATIATAGVGYGVKKYADHNKELNKKKKGVIRNGAVFLK